MQICQSLSGDTQIYTGPASPKSLDTLEENGLYKSRILSGCGINTRIWGTKQHTHFNDLIETILLLYGSHKCASNVAGGGDGLKSHNERIHFFKMLCSWPLSYALALLAYVCFTVSVALGIL